MTAWSYEKRKHVAGLFASLLEEIDPQPLREDLHETPMRAAHAWEEWTRGYAVDPASLIKTFSESAQGYDQLIIVNNVPFHSHCAHHLAAIEGTMHIGYLPGDKVVGLSKLPRIAHAFAARLQTQEALTTQIAECVLEGLGARAVGVIVRARHGCLSTRGARVHSAVMTTSAMLGKLRDDSTLRAEFLALCHAAERETSA